MNDPGGRVPVSRWWRMPLSLCRCERSGTSRSSLPVPVRGWVEHVRRRRGMVSSRETDRCPTAPSRCPPAPPGDSPACRLERGHAGHRHCRASGRRSGTSRLGARGASPGESGAMPSRRSYVPERVSWQDRSACWGTQAEVLDSSLRHACGQHARNLQNGLVCAAPDRKGKRRSWNSAR